MAVTVFIVVNLGYGVYETVTTPLKLFQRGLGLGNGVRPT